MFMMVSRFARVSCFLVALFHLFCEVGSSAAAASIDLNRSRLAIVTQKEGIASGFAHRHIIVAENWLGQVDRKANASGRLEKASAVVSLPVASLVVDSNEASRDLINLLTDAKVWSLSEDSLSPENSAKVRQNMLDDSQLGAEKYPTIEGEGTIHSCRHTLEGSSNCTLDLRLRVRGRDASKSVSVAVKKIGDSEVAEFLAKFKFSDFSIKPYSALMGAIAVSDEFVLVARIFVN